MKTKKYFLYGIVVLVAIIGFSMIACDNGGVVGTDNTPKPTTTTTPTTPTIPDTPTTPTTNCTFDNDGWKLFPSAVQSATKDGLEWNRCTNHDGQHVLYRTLYAWGSCTYNLDGGLALTLNAAQTEYNVDKNDTLDMKDVLIPAYYGYRRYVREDGSEIKIGTYADFKPVTEIVEKAFSENSKIENVTFLSGTQLIAISEEAFAECTSLKTITFPPDSGLSSIGKGAFENCTSLDSIEIPSRVTSIGLEAFKGAEALARINIPVGITIINKSVFENCETLATVVFARSDRVATIDEKAFADCKALKSFTRSPNNLRTIGEEAFSNCTSFAKFEITELVAAVGKKAFNGWDLSSGKQQLVVLGRVAPITDPLTPHATADEAWGVEWREGIKGDVTYVE